MIFKKTTKLDNRKSENLKIQQPRFTNKCLVSSDHILMVNQCIFLQVVMVPCEKQVGGSRAYSHEQIWENDMGFASQVWADPKHLFQDPQCIFWNKNGRLLVAVIDSCNTSYPRSDSQEQVLRYTREPVVESKADWDIYEYWPGSTNTGMTVYAKQLTGHLLVKLGFGTFRFSDFWFSRCLLFATYIWKTCWWDIEE